MYAVIKSGGRQFKVAVGQTLEVNRLPVDDGAQVKFDEVLLISDADRTMLGTPFVDNAIVLATATRQSRGEKVIVFKYKPKKRYRHRRGHRQELTVLTIDDILADGISLVTGEAPKAKEVPSVDEPVAPEAVEAAAEIETPTTEAETEISEEKTAEEETEEKTTRRRRRTRIEDEDSESRTEE